MMMFGSKAASSSVGLNGLVNENIAKKGKIRTGVFQKKFCISTNMK